MEWIPENLAFDRGKLEGGSGHDEAVVTIMRTVFGSEAPRTLARVLAKLGGERRPPSLKLPKAIARAAAAPIEERVVVGTRDEVVARLARYREELGMNLLVARPMIGGATLEEQQASLVCLIEDVVPALQ